MTALLAETAQISDTFGKLNLGQIRDRRTYMHFFVLTNPNTEMLAIFAAFRRSKYRCGRLPTKPWYHEEHHGACHYDEGKVASVIPNGGY